MTRLFKSRKFYKRKRSNAKAARAAVVARFRRRRRSNQTRLLRGPVNKTCIAKLKYCETVTFTPATGAMYAYEFRANDLYDPNVTGTGHQPMGFDEIMNNYNHFTVVGSKITVDISAPIGKPALMGLELQAGQGNGTTTGTEFKERQRTRWSIKHPDSSTGYAHGKYSMKFGAKKFFHVKAIVGESQYKGNAAGSPSEQAFFLIYGGAHDGASATGVFTANVIIQYIAVFSEPKSIGQS